MIKPTLPQNAGNLAARNALLERRRETYRFDFSSYDFGFPEEVPKSDGYSLELGAKYYKMRAELMANKAAAALSGQHEDVVAKQEEKAESEASKAEENEETMRANWASARATFLLKLRKDLPGNRPETLDGYRDLLKVVGVPPVADRWLEDWDFAYQRVAGFNPVVISRVEGRLPDKIPLSPEVYRRVIGNGDSLEGAIAEGRLFLTDYSILDGLAVGDGPFGLDQFLSAAIGIYAWHEGKLMPVGIQCSQTPSEEDPIFTPQDGMAWRLAKTTLQVADSNHHGVAMHGALCHLVMGSITLCTFRQLAVDHPISVLLTPNFEFTLTTAQGTRDFVLNREGMTPRLQSVSLEGSIELMRRALGALDWNADHPPSSFEGRNVLGTDGLPDYPFRDDSLKIWEATRRFVDQYLRLHYTSDTDVIEDTEVRAWIEELGSNEGGRIKGIGNDGSIETFDQLATFVAQVIHRAATFHAAINYSLFEAESFIPNQPTAAYAPPPVGGRTYTEADHLAMMPPITHAFEQIADVYVVGKLRVNRLGHFKPGTFEDERTLPIVKQFQGRLDAIESEIEADNEKRPFAYTILLPSLITSSIQV